MASAYQTTQANPYLRYHNCYLAISIKDIHIHGVNMAMILNPTLHGSVPATAMHIHCA